MAKHIALCMGLRSPAAVRAAEAMASATTEAEIDAIIAGLVAGEMTAREKGDLEYAAFFARRDLRRQALERLLWATICPQCGGEMVANETATTRYNACSRCKKGAIGRREWVEGQEHLSPDERGLRRAPGSWGEWEISPWERHG